MLAVCSICFLKTINYIEVQTYLFGINGLKAKHLYTKACHRTSFVYVLPCLTSADRQPAGCQSLKSSPSWGGTESAREASSPGCLSGTRIKNMATSNFPSFSLHCIKLSLLSLVRYTGWEGMRINVKYLSKYHERSRFQVIRVHKYMIAFKYISSLRSTQLHFLYNTK